jgi:histidinol-phosphate/aromatic aminotransferase/cobyric acid decarboxylase-like protein
MGVGSDEVIDTLIRAFCAPGREKILTCPPTYGMYSVSAQINDVSLVKVPLKLPAFDLDVPAIQKALVSDSSIKLAYLCSPGGLGTYITTRSSTSDEPIAVTLCPVFVIPDEPSFRRRVSPDL